MKKKRIIIVVLSLIIVSLIGCFAYLNLSAKPSVTYGIVDCNTISVSAKSNNLFSSKLQIAIDNNQETSEETVWKDYIQTDTYVLNKGNYYIHVKGKNNKVSTCDKNDLISFELKSKYNLPLYPVNDELNIDYDYVAIGNPDLSFKSSDENIAYIQDNKIYTKAPGTVTITIVSKTIELNVTNLYTVEDYSIDKPYLKETICNDEENALLDEVLKIKIDEAGFKTRAGVVKAARFLSLQFPYKIAYFSESGRLDTTNDVTYCDGEGRYYHYGLFLSAAKFDELEASVFGPKYWGQFFEEDDSDDHSLDEFYLGDGFVPADIGTHLYLSKRPNGLDCSGFVAWCYYNGGFDLGDMGAGGPTSYGMTDLGEFVYIDDELLQSDKIKAGDLVGYSGHIGIVIGVEDDYIWIADTSVSGLKVTKFERNVESFEQLGEDAWKYFMLMDDVYIDDGNYSEMW